MLLPKQNLKPTKDFLPKLDNRIQGRIFKGDFITIGMYDSTTEFAASSGKNFASIIPVKAVRRI